ncbi:hypothetical protein H1C71_013500 [Ictidomys tridecemlineatus]|nr:hypothetical protein H1C71_013500 [Ictidomys tridecemlineatus]KAG3292218.1 hypothetical protein H1C71_013500 [Ictidomys tridecemlineatus]
MNDWVRKMGDIQKEIKCFLLQAVAKVTCFQELIPPCKELLMKALWATTFLPVSWKVPFSPFGHIGKIRGGGSMKQRSLKSIEGAGHYPYFLGHQLGPPSLWRSLTLSVLSFKQNFSHLPQCS